MKKATITAFLIVIMASIPSTLLSSDQKSPEKVSPYIFAASFQPHHVGSPQRERTLLARSSSNSPFSISTTGSGSTPPPLDLTAGLIDSPPMTPIPPLSLSLVSPRTRIISSGLNDSNQSEPESPRSTPSSLPASPGLVEPLAKIAAASVQSNNNTIPGSK